MEFGADERGRERKGTQSDSSREDEEWKGRKRESVEPLPTILEHNALILSPGHRPMARTSAVGWLQRGRPGRVGRVCLSRKTSRILLVVFSYLEPHAGDADAYKSAMQISSPRRVPRVDEKPTPAAVSGRKARCILRNPHAFGNWGCGNLVRNLESAIRRGLPKSRVSNAALWPPST